jgi:hypothetical protein
MQIRETETEISEFARVQLESSACPHSDDCIGITILTPARWTQGMSVAVKIDAVNDQQAHLLFGRHFDHTHRSYLYISQLIYLYIYIYIYYVYVYIYIYIYIYMYI